jgi:hypothetical protein
VAVAVVLMVLGPEQVRVPALEAAAVCLKKLLVSLTLRIILLSVLKAQVEQPESTPERREATLQ